MSRMRFVWIAALPVCVWFAGCGDPQSNPARNSVVGGDRFGAPVPRGVSDKAIVGDLSGYTPAKPPTVGAAGESKGTTGRDTGGAPSDDITGALTTLASNVSSGQVEVALKTFNPKHVEALAAKDVSDAMYVTFESVDQIRKILISKFDPAKAGALGAALFNFAEGAPDVQQVDADNASISPNYATILFGPTITKNALKAQRVDGKWQFQLDKPITAAEAKEIVAYHTKLKATLENIWAAIDSGAVADEAKIKEMLIAARNGQDVEIPAAAVKPEGDGEKKDGEEKKDDGEQKEDEKP